MEVDALLIGNDKNNVIANKVLSYFQCLNLKVEITLQCLGLNNNY